MVQLKVLQRETDSGRGLESRGPIKSTAERDGQGRGRGRGHTGFGEVSSQDCQAPDPSLSKRATMSVHVARKACWDCGSTCRKRSTSAQSGCLLRHGTLRSARWLPFLHPHDPPGTARPAREAHSGHFHLKINPCLQGHSSTATVCHTATNTLVSLPGLPR